MTWLWFVIFGVIAMAARGRLAAAVSKWQHETLRSVSWIGLIFFGALALFGNEPTRGLLLVQMAAAVGGILSVFTIGELISRSSASAEAQRVQRLLDRQRRSGLRARHERADTPARQSPARVAELLNRFAQEREQAATEAAAEDQDGRHAVIQIDEGDNVRGVAIVGGAAEPAAQPAVPPQSRPAAAADEAEAEVKAVEPDRDDPPPLEQVSEAEVAEDVEPAPAETPAASQRPPGPVSLGGLGSLRDRGPVQLGVPAAAAGEKGPVSLSPEHPAEEPQAATLKPSSRFDRSPAGADGPDQSPA